MQLLNKFLVLGLVYSFPVPILYLLCAAYCWSAQWIDRINFLRQLRPPPPTHGQSMMWVYTYILPFAIMMHSLAAIKFFHDVCYEINEAPPEDSSDRAQLTAEEIIVSAQTDQEKCYAALGATFGTDNHATIGGGASLPIPSGCLEERADAANLVELATAFFNRSGTFTAEMAAAGMVEAELHCVTVHHGNASTAAACSIQTPAGTRFCNDLAWSSAKGIIYASTVITGLVLLYYVFDTRAKLRAAERRAVTKQSDDRKAWARHHGSLPSEEAKAAAEAYQASQRKNQKAVGSGAGVHAGVCKFAADSVQTVYDTATAAGELAGGLAVNAVNVAAVPARPITKQIGRLVAKTDATKTSATHSRKASRGLTAKCFDIEAVSALGRFVASLRGVHLTGRLFLEMVMQRHFKERDEAGGHLAADAHVRPEIDEHGTAMMPQHRGSTMMPLHISLSSPDASGRVPTSPSGANRHEGSNQLDEDAVMYLPPLVSMVLTTYCKDVTDQHTRTYLRDRDRQISGTLKDSSPRPSEANQDSAIPRWVPGPCNVAAAMRTAASRTTAVMTRDRAASGPAAHSRGASVTPENSDGSCSIRDEPSLTGKRPAPGHRIHWADTSARSPDSIGSIDTLSSAADGSELMGASLPDIAFAVADATALLSDLSARSASRDSLNSRASDPDAPDDDGSDASLDEVDELEALAATAARIEKAVEATRLQIAERAEVALRRGRVSNPDPLLEPVEEAADHDDALEGTGQSPTEAAMSSPRADAALLEEQSERGAAIRPAMS